MAPPERVWAVMIDVERWPEWTDSVSSVQRLDSGPLSVGSRVRIEQPKLSPATFRITSLAPGRAFVWVTRSGGIDVSASHPVEPAANGSRAELSVEFKGVLAPIVTRLARGLIVRYLNMEAAGLKQRSEMHGAR